MIELSGIQGGALYPRPSPYVGKYVLIRIDDPRSGRELLRRLMPAVTPAADAAHNYQKAWVGAALTFQGLKAMGVPQDSLDSFPIEFRQGMAARAVKLGDVGDSAPENWEKPLGTPDVHVAISALSPDKAQLEAVLSRAQKAYEQTSGIRVLWSLDCYALPTDAEHFGFRDGISQPAIEGSGIPGTNSKETPLKTGEFLLGYIDETGAVPPIPQPEILGRNGTYVVFRKLHQRVAAFRQYLKANSLNSEEEELLAAKMMGRWRSGAPLALCPFHDNPELGADRKFSNDFLFNEDDPKGFKTPTGSHIRRMNPRDSVIIGVTRLHRMIRRGDGRTDWPLDTQGNHPLTEFLLADFMVVDASKPFSEDSYLEIERALLNGTDHKTCGGRSLNEDSLDTFMTLLVNAGNGPRISDGVDQQAVPASRAFPYLVPPEANPPPIPAFFVAAQNAFK